MSRSTGRGSRASISATTMPSTWRLQTTGFTNSTAGCGTACGPRCRTRQLSTRPSKPCGRHEPAAEPALSRESRRPARTGRARPPATVTRPRWAMNRRLSPTWRPSRPRTMRSRQPTAPLQLTRDGDRGANRGCRRRGDISPGQKRRKRHRRQLRGLRVLQSQWDTGGVSVPRVRDSAASLGSGVGRSPVVDERLPVRDDRLR